MVSDSIFSCTDVSKAFTSGKGKINQALNKVSLDIRRGQIVALLGPNGAGKSTLINIIGGLTIKDQGQVRVNGYDLDRYPKAVRSQVGIVPQELVMDPFFTPRQVLRLTAGLYGFRVSDRAISALLTELELSEKADSYARRLSGGMKRRLMVAKAMVHSPTIVFLDEPTAGVDVVLRKRLWAYVQRLNQTGVTIVLTTHYIAEAEQLCDSVAFIKQGAIIAYDRVDRLLSTADRKELRLWRSVRLPPDEKLSRTPSLTGKLHELEVELRDQGSHLSIRYQPSRIATYDLLVMLKQQGIEFDDVSMHDPSLEDIFLELTTPT